MESNYDFSDAIKNPFAGREKGKFTVTVHYDFTNNPETVSEKQEEETFRKLRMRKTDAVPKK